MTEHTNQYCNCHDCTQVRYKSSLAGQADAAMNNAQPAAPPAPTAIQQSCCMICGKGVVDGTLACGHVYTGWLDMTPAPQGGKCFGKHGPAPDTRPAEAQEPNRFIPDMAHCARCKKADNLHSPDGICPPQEPKVAGCSKHHIVIENCLHCREVREAQEPRAQDNPTWMDDCINVCSRHSVQFTKERDECFVCTNRASHAPTVTALFEEAENIKKISYYLEEHCGKDADFILRAETKSGTMDIVIRKNIAALRTAIAAVK